MNFFDFIKPFDDFVMNFVQGNLHNVVTDTIFPVITYLGETGIIWIIIGLILLIIKKTRRWGLLVLLSMLFCYLVGELLIKNIVCRPRPFIDNPSFTLLISAPKSFSFPSGHSGSSFAASTAIFIANKKWGIAAYILAFLIAFSRVFLYVHYPSDVVAGIILGVLSAIIVFMIFKLISQKKSGYVPKH